MQLRVSSAMNSREGRNRQQHSTAQTRSPNSNQVMQLQPGPTMKE